MAAPTSAPPRPGPRRLGTAVVLALAGLVLPGCAGPGDEHRKAPGRSPTPSAPVAPEPFVEPGSPAVPVPVGSQPTPDGAVAAAVAYVTNGQALLDADPAVAERMVREGAAAATADAQAAALRQRLAALRRVLEGGSGWIRYQQAALATRLESFRSERARVAVWHVAVLSRAGVAPPQAGWALSVVDLVWERGGWRLEFETVSPGPAPILDASAPPATVEELETALEGFTARGWQ